MLQPFQRNFFRLQTIKRFARGGDVAFCQITLTTCLCLLFVMQPQSSLQTFLTVKFFYKNI